MKKIKNVVFALLVSVLAVCCLTKVEAAKLVGETAAKKALAAGIEEVVMTTGYYDGVLVKYCQSLELPLHFTFVNNPKFV